MIRSAANLVIPFHIKCLLIAPCIRYMSVLRTYIHTYIYWYVGYECTCAHSTLSGVALVYQVGGMPAGDVAKARRTRTRIPGPMLLMLCYSDVSHLMFIFFAYNV